SAAPHSFRQARSPLGCLPLPPGSPITCSLANRAGCCPRRCPEPIWSPWPSHKCLFYLDPLNAPHLAAHQLLDLGIALRPRWDGGKRRADQQCHRGRHDAHLIPPVANASASLRANSTAAPRIAELIRVHLTFPFVPAKVGTQGPHALALDSRLRGNE